MVSADINILPLTASDALPAYTVCKKQQFHFLQLLKFFPGMCREEALQLPVILSWAIMFMIITLVNSPLETSLSNFPIH